MSQEGEPHRDLNQAHNSAAQQKINGHIFEVPEPLYRMRLSVLKDGEGTRDCPIRMFTFNTEAGLRNAIEKVTSTFGGAFSEYPIVRDGVLSGENSGYEPEDGRTENVEIKFDSQTADETWHEFLGRMDNVKKDWQVEELGIKTQRGGGVHAGAARDVTLLN